MASSTCPDVLTSSILITQLSSQSYESDMSDGKINRPISFESEDNEETESDSQQGKWMKEGTMSNTTDRLEIFP